MQYRRELRKNHWVVVKCWLSMPFIWGMVVPLMFLDVTMEVYHRVCFWLYGIGYVKRSKYIKIDRHKLAYLAWYEKIACAYCGYANGLLAYSVEIAGETEKYWCGIMHKKYSGFVPPKHQDEFLKYGDEQGFKKFAEGE